MLNDSIGTYDFDVGIYYSVHIWNIWKCSTEINLGTYLPTFLFYWMRKVPRYRV